MIHIIIGTKAQLIKMAPLMNLLQKRGVYYNYISTGQHNETINDIISNFDVKEPDYVLYKGEDIVSTFKMAWWFITLIGKSIANHDKIFQSDENGIILVHGDTLSTLLGALLGKLIGMNVAHIESGLRSFNLSHPFPEEITRILTFKLSNYYFCPNSQAISNLKNEHGVKINTNGNTLFDALKIALPSIKRIEHISIPKNPYAIVTLHRYENIYNKESLGRVVQIVENIARNNYLIFILHKPTEYNLRKFNYYNQIKNNKNIELRPRYTYFDFIKLLLDANFVVSDGGSNQEECYYLGKPIILLRESTERDEGLDRNCVLSKYDDLVIDEFLDNIDQYRFDFFNLDTSPCEIIIDSCLPFS